MLSVRLALFCINFRLEHTSTFAAGFQYNLAHLFSIMSRCAISNICSDKSKVTLQCQMLKFHQKGLLGRGLFQQNNWFYLLNFEFFLFRLDKNGPCVDSHAISYSYLRELWEHKSPDGTIVFVNMCSVQQILKISLKYVCDYCGSMVTKSRCSNTGCFNTEMGRFLARARYLFLALLVRFYRNF